jgi:predicted dehydrogenase
VESRLWFFCKNWVCVLKQVNLGLIGLGYQGKSHLRNCLSLKGVKVLGVADVSKKALKYAKKKGVKNVYANYEDLLKSKQLDAVVISLPNFLHLEGVMKAAEAGNDILLEKPLARNVEEGKQILSAVRKSGVKLMMGNVMRFVPSLRNIHDKIADGFFGSVQIVEATNISGGPFAPRSDSVGPIQVPSWWLNKELAGGGALLDLGSHMIDLLVWSFGEVVYVKSYLSYMLKMDLEDTALCILKFKDGPIATVKVGWFSQDFAQSLQVCGTTKNMLVCIFPQSTVRIALRKIKTKFGLHKTDPDDLAQARYLELEHFVKCLQEDELPQPSGEDGLSCLQVISLAYENAVNVSKKFE